MNRKIVSLQLSDYNSHPNSLKLIIAEWQNCIICSLLLAYTILQDFLYSAFNAELIQALQVSALEFSGLSSIYLYTLALSLIPVGILYDRKPIKQLLVLAASLSLIAALIFWGSSNFWLHVLNRILCGLANAFAFIGGLRVIIACNTKRATFATGLLFAIGNLGGIIASWPYLHLKECSHWRIVLLVNIVLGLIVLFLCLNLLKNLPNNNHSIPTTFMQALKDIFAKLKTCSSNYNNWLCGLYAGIFYLPDTLFACLWGITYLTEKYAFTETQAGSVISSFVIGIAIGGPLLGWFADQGLPKRTLMILGGATCLMLILSIFSVPNLSLTGLMILFTCLGIAACSEILAFTSIKNYCSEEHIATSFALVTLIMNLLNATARPLYGWLLERNWDGMLENNLPIYSTVNMEQAFMILPIGFICSIMIAFFIKGHSSHG